MDRGRSVVGAFLVVQQVLVDEAAGLPVGADAGALDLLLTLDHGDLHGLAESGVGGRDAREIFGHGAARSWRPVGGEADGVRGGK